MTNEQAKDSPERTLGRNERCHCGSGKKYKQCCLSADEAAAREARARQAEEAAAQAGSAEPAEGEEDAKAQGRKRAGKRESTHQPWKRASQKAGGGNQRTLPRTVGS